MTEQLDLEDWLREHPANSDDTQNEVSGITLKDSKINGLSGKNTSEVITPNHPQTNSDDRNAKVWFELYLKKAKENQQLKELLKECGEMSFKIRLALSSGKINDVFTLTYQIENEIVKATGEK